MDDIDDEYEYEYDDDNDSSSEITMEQHFSHQIHE